MNTKIQKITFLGTGTSHGIPVIACDCAVCASTDPKDKRTRSSLLIELTNGKNILIDSSIDLRQQCLTNKIRHVEAVLFTHCHADHVFGLDDMRLFNWLQKEDIVCHASSEHCEELRRIFAYAFGGAVQQGGGLPQLDLRPIAGTFKVYGLPVIPFEVKHGISKVTAFRFENIAYITDCSFIPEENYELLKGLDILVLDALRHRKHPTHFNLEEAIAVARRIGAKQTYFTHIAHELGHEETNAKLPENMQLAYDGLALQIGF
ncbi:MAG: MBL fold metallo-hydrolase [Candidatus Margulisiibacteriota bacterium]|jgi:phosphoribosyl 1,2-cyclic phosphate phosphodiesterase